jgi:hypothetical protein
MAQLEAMIANSSGCQWTSSARSRPSSSAGINDPGHFAYPTYAKAAIQRRDNLSRSINDLRINSTMLAHRLPGLRGAEKVEILKSATTNARLRAMQHANRLNSTVGGQRIRANSNYCSGMIGVCGAVVRTSTP